MLETVALSLYKEYVTTKYKAKKYSDTLHLVNNTSYKSGTYNMNDQNK